MAEAKTDKIEREYIIPLRRRWKIVPRYQRTNKAVKTVKEFLARHMKIRDKDLNKIKLDRYLNEILWHRGIKNPPAKIKVLAVKEGEIVKVTALEMPQSIKFKKLREEKTETKAKEVAKKRKEEKAEKAEEAKPEIQETAEKEKEEKEKKEAVIEAGKEIEKAAAQKEKHTTKTKSQKQEKNARTGYNQSGRGH
jgi:large subunit ribosomal protein L31e